MIHKRPFIDDDSYEVVCKHPRQFEHIDNLDPVVPSDPHQMRLTSEGEGEGTHSRCHNVEKSASDSMSEISNGADKDFGSGGTICFPHFLWINSGILESDNISFFPEYFGHVNSPRPLLQPDQIISSIDYPLQKSVLIGPDYQAYVPEWSQNGSVTSVDELDKSDTEVGPAQSSTLGVIVDEEHERNLMGTCVVQMPELGASATYCSEGTGGNCSCDDKGSFRCVREHITEARQRLREKLGEKVFQELGFCDMGEEVAKKWSEEEDQTFYEVILSNPFSLGKNFWEHLSFAFPSRTKKELVSYYFNVFKLRKRAKQNRSDPLNIDSDDDEWQTCEAGTAEEEEVGRPFNVCFQEGHWSLCLSGHQRPDSEQSNNEQV